jgi:hypothetical protein
MKDTFVWKAEIKFSGTAEEFNKLTTALEKLPAEFEIPEWHFRPCHFAGCMAVPVELLLEEAQLKELAKGMRQMKIKFLKDIEGGIRTAHFHLGDQVVLLDRARFKEYVAIVAKELGGRRAETVDDYIGVMNQIGHLSDPTPQPIAGMEIRGNGGTM